MTIVRDIEIPAELEDVSPAWLSRALAAAHPGAEVSAVRPESLHQGTASTWRLHLDYAPGSAPGPRTVCIKSDFGLPHREHLARTGLYRKEASVYLDILPRATARTILCYAAAHDAAGRGFMLMQDVIAAGGGFCDPVSTLSPTQVGVGVEQLAELHAATWQAPMLTAPEWMHHGKPLSVEDPFWNAIFDRYDDVLATPHAPAMARIFRDGERMRAAFNRLRAFDDPIARSLIHGDAHVGNFFVDRNGDPGMADFQCVQRGHVTHDLSTFIGSSLDVVDRRTHERALLERYLARLARRGVQAPSFDEIWLGYRRHYVYSLFVWLSTTATFQPQAHLVANVFRYGMAALDLDTLGALQ